jgi:LysR family transcriptional regulator, regulator for bpeEF and oprC
MIRNIDLNKIIDFVKIVELGNITRAADALNERKAKLSRNLAILERELGVQLVYRTTRQFRLTELGQRFFIESKKNLENLESSVLKIQNKDDQIKGKIKLTAPEDLGRHIITPLISEFCALHPKVDFELIFTSDVLDLVKLGIDISFRVGKMKDSSLIQKKAGRISLALVASPKYLEKNKAPLQIEDIANHKTIGLIGKERFTWKLFSKSEKQIIELKPHITTNSFVSVLDLAVQGQGIAYIPIFLTDQAIKSGQLTQLLKSWGSEEDQVQVTIPHQKNIPRLIRQFFDFSVKYLDEKL